MSNTMISVQSIENDEKNKNIIIKAYDLEKALIQGKFEEELELITFSFSREKRGEMNYLFKLISGKVKGASIQEMFNKLSQGAILIINDNFKVK